ncbi:MAG: phytanoyl-CoA dioxygenase family protein [Burkholderiaceae bacterium]|nr:phytanoyl-CoA dioxygenase family protein [Burkholderiaceae bacterium]
MLTSARQYLDSALAHFQEKGYVVLPQSISHHVVDGFWQEVDDQIQNNPELTMVLFGEVIKNAQAQGELLSNGNVLRIIDIENHSPRARDLMLDPAITEFLTAYYDHPPTAIQTITYKYSSQQGTHSDLHLVSPPGAGGQYDRESLTAAWIACEDADETNGALVIYPGSHRLLKKSLQFFDMDYGRWVEYLDSHCRKMGCPPTIFHARRGDVLFWHGDLVHAGGPILQPGKTRKSLVVHYARIPESTPPAVPGLTKRRHRDGWLFQPAQVST